MPKPGAQREIDKAIAHLMDWADTPEWEDMKGEVLDSPLMDAADLLEMDPADISDLLVQHDLAGMMFGLCFEDLASLRIPPDDRNLVDDFLKRRGWREGVRGRRYLRQLSQSVLSLYEVVDLAPGSHCDLVDLVRGGKPVRVYEQSGTRSMAQWDHIAARVLPGDGKRIFSGVILPFSPEASGVLQEILKDTRRRIKRKFARRAKTESFDDIDVSIDLEVLKDSAPVFSQVWLTQVVGRLQAPSPEIVTPDGDPFVFAETRLTYERLSGTSICALLDTAKDWERESGDEFSWAWLSDGGDETEFPTSVHCFLTMTDDELWLTANSLNRSEKGIAALVGLLGDLVTPQLTQLQSPEQLLAEEGETMSSAPGFDPAEIDMDPDELSDFMSEYFDQHYRKALDEPIPALDNKTPRQCIRTKSGKNKVIAWLKYLENQEYRKASKSGGTAYDFSWMWKELGLEKPGKK